MFAIDMKKSSEYGSLCGIDEKGEKLFLAEIGKYDEKSGVFGIDFPYGTTGMASLSDGSFLFSRDFRDENGWGTDIALYEFDEEKGFVEK